MKPDALAALAVLAALSAPALAQPAALTGTSLLLTLARLKGVPLTAADLARPEVVATLAARLGLTPDVTLALVRAGSAPINASLATTAVLQSATGKPVTPDQVAALLAKTPSLAVSSLEGALALASNPTAANDLATAAQTPVTPRGGGR